MDAQRIAVDAVVALTDCDREAAVAFIRGLYLAGAGSETNNKTVITGLVPVIHV